MTTTGRCRYCGAAPHTPSNACPTTAQKASRRLGLVWLSLLGFLVLLGVLVALSAQLPTNW
jgi:hypothetical protein